MKFAGIFVRSRKLHPVAVVEPPLIIVAKKVAVSPTWTDRLVGKPAKIELDFGFHGRKSQGDGIRDPCKPPTRRSLWSWNLLESK